VSSAALETTADVENAIQLAVHPGGKYEAGGGSFDFRESTVRTWQ
jgi:hypothetical protein